MSEMTHAALFDLLDYARFPRRLASWLIDLAVLFTLLTAIGVYVELKYVPREVMAMPHGAQRQREIARYFRPHQASVFGVWMACFAAYHIPLRRTRGGTLGYRLTRMRLVDQFARPPSWAALIKRFLIALPTAGLLGATYLPCRSHNRRQAVHDRWSGTWMVRARAKPAGPAGAIYQTKFFGTMPLTYLDLEPLDPLPIVQ